MTLLLDQSLALRSAARDQLPAGDTLDECLAALDRVDACFRLFDKLDVKAAADAIAGVDIDTLAAVEKDATIALVMARAASSTEKAAQVARAQAAIDLGAQEVMPPTKA